MISRDLFISRLDTTTLYHLEAMLWHDVKHQFLLNKMQLFSCSNKLPWQQPCKTHYILTLVALYLKNELAYASFLLRKSDQHARLKFSAV